MKLKKIFCNLPKYFNISFLQSKKIQNVFGNDVLFPKLYKDRPYTIASFVISIDGKITYQDDKRGNLIANNNFLDKKGAELDFFIMNMLRSFSDAIIIGSGTINHNPNFLGGIYYEELIIDRLNSSKSKYPINIIPTLTGKSLPYNHKIFLNLTIPLIILTTHKAIKYICNNLPINSSYVINKYSSYEDLQRYKQEIIDNYNSNKHKIIILSFSNSHINNQLVMLFLKIININIVSIEASNYFHSLVRDNLVDEIFLNISSVYLGGLNGGIAELEKPFDSKNHPHLKILEIYIHKNNFLYTRQKFNN